MNSAAVEPTGQFMAGLLQAIAAAAPAPWYPADFARQATLPREVLDEPLAKLRMAGLVRLTDWEAGRGQGYLLTTDGVRALNDPQRFLSRQESRATSRQPIVLPAITTDSTVTRLLIAAQVGVFLLGLIQAVELGIGWEPYLSNTAGVRVFHTLALSAPAVRAGCWWTLLSYALVHGNLLHLGCNLLGHVSLATVVERLLGHWRFAVVYVVSVWCGGVGALLAAPHVRTVGSSGGICGVFAALVVWSVARRHMFHESEWFQMRQNFTRSVILILVISLAPGVSWGGHLGGAVGGAATTALFEFTLASSKSRKIAAWMAICATPVLGAVLIWWRIL